MANLSDSSSSSSDSDDEQNVELTNTLSLLFPHHSKSQLRYVILNCGNNLDNCIEYLLDDGTGTEQQQTKIQQPPPQQHQQHQQHQQPQPIKIPFSLNHQLKDFINNERFADVELVLRNNNNNNSQGEVLFAHSPILWARSVIFESLLMSGSEGDNKTTTTDNKKVLILDEGTKEDILLLLEYLYTDTLESLLKSEKKEGDNYNFTETPHNLLLIADNYCLPRLREICEQGTTSPSLFGSDLMRLLAACNSRIEKEILDIDLPNNNNNNKDTGIEERVPFDVIFSVEGDEIRAHKFILSKASEYFRALFLGYMKEADSAISKKLAPVKIEIPDTSMTTFYKLLKIIYGNGEISFPEEQTLEYFVESARFMLWDIQNYCENILRRNITCENVCNILECSKGVSDKLTQASIQYPFLKLPQG